MKIGILTLHRPANFGANLQAYATVSYMRSLGHEVRVIDYVRQRDLDYRGSVPQAQMEAHRRFVEERLPLTRRVTDSAGLRAVAEEERFDIILIGADAVWNAPKDDNIYFAQWLFRPEEIHGTRVASLAPAHMSASTSRRGGGFSALPEAQRQAIGDCLRRFSYITVRDEWTRTVINRDIFHGQDFVRDICPDPVFSLPLSIGREEWQSQGIAARGYWLMTLPRDWGAGRLFGRRRRRWFARFKGLVNAAGYRLVELPLPEGRSGMPFDHVVDYPIDPMQWFLWIRNARAFCGLRFHAVVSGIACGTPFYSVDSYGNKSLSNILLDVLGLHRLARRRDGGSKIARLLAGTPFERCRTGLYLEWESLRRVFRLLDGADAEALTDMAERKRAELLHHINKMLS